MRFARKSLAIEPDKTAGTGDGARRAEPRLQAPEGASHRMSNHTKRQHRKCEAEPTRILGEGVMENAGVYVGMDLADVQDVGGRFDRAAHDMLLVTVGWPKDPIARTLLGCDVVYGDDITDHPP